ncbi:hypothetical protein GTW61_27835 [Streptomyces sp. SID4921]|nr:hypothetical protein [Streptomyces sp. SID4921]
MAVGGGPLRGACPLPAPSRNRGSAPGPAPQTPEGLEGGALPRGPAPQAPEGLEGGRRGWRVGRRAGLWGLAPGPVVPGAPAEGLGCGAGFGWPARGPAVMLLL